VNKQKLFRTLQTNFPALLDTKFAAQRAYRQLRRRPFEHDFSALSLFECSAKSLYLDVGANRGQSIDAILLTTPSGVIQAYEPNPLLFEKIQAIHGQSSRVKAFNFGLGDEPGEFTLHVPFYKDWMFDGLASFDAEEATGWLRNRLYNFNDKHLSTRQVRCELKRLDDLNLDPTLIKLDVQGLELRVLKGGAKTLERCRPALLVEVGNGAAEFLRGYGYRSYGFRGGRFVLNGATVPNEFFLTDEHIRALQG
jgi:FkbM family methyltransferase